MKPSELAQKARFIYDGQLKTLLEPENNGKAVAVPVDSGDYMVAETHNAAERAMGKRHPEGLFVTLTIGPPTRSDFALAQCILAGQKSRRAMNDC